MAKESFTARFNTMKEFTENYFKNNITFKIISDEILNAPEPDSLESANEMLGMCLHIYEDNLLLKINSKPYSDISEILKATQKLDKEALKDPVLELLKSFDYDSVIELTKKLGGSVPDPHYVKRLKRGGFLDFRLSNVHKLLNSLEFTPETLSIFSRPELGLTILELGMFLFAYASIVKISASLHKGDPEKSLLLDNHAQEYLSLVSRYALMQIHKSMPASFSKSLIYIISTLQFDLMQMSGILCTDEFVNFMSKIQASSNRKKGWKELDSYYANAISTAEQRWINGDARLHHEMALDLLEEINEPIRDKIIDELLKKHPSRKTTEEMAAFEKEKKKLFDYKTLSFRALKAKIRPVAAKFHKLYDPGAAYRSKKS